jgi:Carboxypeptidase regulatory-like domain
MRSVFLRGLLLVLVGVTTAAYAQFSSNLQGTVTDPSGAVVPGATVTLTNSATGVSQKTTAGPEGVYRFVSVAPGTYQVSTSASGFATHIVNIELRTSQTLDVPVTLSVSKQSTTVSVTDQPPVLDTAETRTEMTIGTQSLDSLPLPGHNLLALTSLAPGVTGLGIIGSGGNGQSNDNYAAETQVSASANGRYTLGNMYVVDGLDITSDITPGVLNLVPNPDTIQEATVQVNTYNVDYGRSSSMVEVMTTKSGTDHYHFLASEYYTNDTMTAGTEFSHNIPKFHSNNISATLGGPIPLLHHTYFFTGWEPLLALTQSTNSSATFEDPQFTAWAKANFPNTIGTQLLAAYPASNVSDVKVAKTAQAIYGSSCGTAAEGNIPCTLPVFDTGVFNATNTRNALQYNVRIDKYFKNDRIYGNYYNTSLDLGGPSIRVDMESPQHYIVRSVQANETHTFSPDTLNQVGFGFLRMEGLLNKTGPFHVPIVSVSGWNVNIGVSKAHENYVQHHYTWRDVLTHIYKTHDLSFGYEGFHGDNLTFFGQWYSQPSFSFQDPVSLVTDNVYSETGVAFNPVTGQQAGDLGGSVRAQGNTWGVFAQDSWKLNRQVTLNYGLRFDDFGNPSPKDNAPLANFFYGSGSTISAQVGNGSVIQVNHAFNHSLTAFSPRAGIAWDVTGRGKWVVRGGFGLYHDWVTLGNVQNEFGNPPASTTPTFLTGTTTPPIFSIGTSDTYPFGFTYPSFPGYGLNSHGGYANSTVQLSISGNDPNLSPSNTLNYSVGLERALGVNFSVAASYSGSHSNDLFTDSAGHAGNAYYGVDINNFPGSLIQNGGKLVRLNQNFGSIRYTVNGPTATYDAFIVEFKGRFWGHGIFDASYTRSSSWDDAGTYPTVPSNTGDYSQYWAPSNWDAPNRYSMHLTYNVPGLHSGPEPVHVLSNGWSLNAITILQSGTPFTVLTSQAFKPVFDSSGNVIGNTGGDYNADGTNSDYPNAPSFGYSIPTSRSADLNSVFKVSDFGVPNFGQEGNEEVNRFRNPGYANTDFALLKNTQIMEKATLQLRLETFNLFNRPNLGGISSNLTSGSFGRATSQYNARFLQVGARFEF